MNISSKPEKLQILIEKILNHKDRQTYLAAHRHCFYARHFINNVCYCVFFERTNRMTTKPSFFSLTLLIMLD